MSDKSDDLYLPYAVIMRIIREAVSWQIYPRPLLLNKAEHGGTLVGLRVSSTRLKI